MLDEASAKNPDGLILSKIFYSLLISRCHNLTKMAPGTTRAFLEAYFKRFFVGNVKRILRSKFSGVAIDESTIVPIPKKYGDPDLKAMSDASSLQDALDCLRHTRFEGVLGMMQFFQKYGLFSLIEAAVDKMFYDSELVPSLENVPDNDTVREMVGIEVDLENLKMIVDLKARGVSVDTIQGLWFNPINLRKEELKLISEASFQSLPEVLTRTRYASLAPLISDALDLGKVESLEGTVRSEVYRRTKSSMIKYADCLAYVVGYVNEVEAEANNMVSVVTGKELGLPEAKIEAMLCL